MRLDDTYYTNNKLDGIPVPPLGPETKLEAPQFYQGETIVLDMYFEYDGKPVTVEDWTLTAVLRSNRYSNCNVWSGSLNAGIYKKDQLGFYRVIITHEETSLLAAGTYWLGVTVTERNVSQGTYKNVISFIKQQPIAIDYGVGSPNPGRDRPSPPGGTYPPTVDARLP